VRLADTAGRRMYCEMNAGNWWCDTHDPLPTGAKIVPVTAQAGTVIPRNNRRKIRVVRKELCYGKAEMLEDAEEAARWWRYNLVR